MKFLTSHFDNSVLCTICPKVAYLKIKTLAETQYRKIEFLISDELSLITATSDMT